MAFDLDEEELRATRKINKADRNEIEVNEYVRFNNGEIGKVIDIKENPSRIVYSEYGEIGLISEIVKHSKNIIDLIEKRRLCKWRTSFTI